MFILAFPQLGVLNIMGLATPQSAILIDVLLVATGLACARGSAWRESPSAGNFSALGHGRLRPHARFLSKFDRHDSCGRRSVANRTCRPWHLSVKGARHDHQVRERN
jgi:hypothetical protein